METSSNFYPFRETALVEITTRWKLSGILVHHENWISFQQNRVTDQVLLIASHLGILLCTLMQNRIHVLLCPACSGLALNGVANTIRTRRYLSLQTRPLSLRIPFLHLYLLAAETNSSGFCPFRISAPVSKVDTRLSRSYSVGLFSVHYTAFPLRTDRLWTLLCSLVSFVPAVQSLIDLQPWSWKHRLLCPLWCEYSQPLSHLLWRRNDKHFVFFRPSRVQWKTILVLLERRKVHFVFLSCSPMGVLARKHLDQGLCQLPSFLSFCWARHSSDWSLASVCYNCSLGFPRRSTGVQTLQMNISLNEVRFFEKNRFCLQILFFVYAGFVERHICAFGS